MTSSNSSSWEVIAYYLPVCPEVGNENVGELLYPRPRPLQVSQPYFILFNNIRMDIFMA